MKPTEFKNVDDIERQYRDRAARAASRRAALRRQEFWFSVARGCTALALFPAAFLAWQGHFSGWFLLLPTALVLFIAQRHEALLEEITTCEHLGRLHEQQLARRQRRWNDVPLPVLDRPPPDADVARDLDIFGPRSVFHWLCLARTPLGRETLADWLMVPATLDILKERQRIVQALAREFDWRESLQLHASLHGDAATTGRSFVRWATGPTWLSQRRGLTWATRVLSLAMLGVVSGAWLSWLEPMTALGLGALLLLVNFSVCFVHTGRIHDLFDQVSQRGDEISHYVSILQIATQLPAPVGEVRVGDADLRSVARDGIARLAGLRHIMTIANLRRAGLLGAVAMLANWMFLWEFHVLAWLEVWQTRHGTSVPQWLSALGAIEALTSLATVAHDEPTWSFPQWAADTTTIQAESLGHPLLARERRVANDVTLGPTGTFLLVTGSNMSGKSTLLRSIGVNVLLAQAGGPVCAQRFVLPPVDVQTSMRVADSLADGVSFFFAELLRLKKVVDRAREAPQRGRLLLYLLDEILQGTNSAERQTAVVQVLRHLLEHGAVGAVSTHDLELASAPALQSACQLVHFRETLSGDAQHQAMTFDYRLRPGISPTTNALVLLKMVGLGTPSE